MIARMVAVSLCARINVPGPLVMIARAMAAILVSRSPFCVAELRHSNLVHNAQLEQRLPAARRSTVSSARLTRRTQKPFSAL
jgi:hypothetical protein